MGTPQHVILNHPSILPDKQLLLAHYESLPFASKGENFWASVEELEMKYRNGVPSAILSYNIKPFYVKWMVMYSVRVKDGQDIDLGILNMVIDALKNDFGGLNELSVEIALKMNIKEELGEYINPFNSIDSLFITKVLTKYKKKLEEINRQAIKIRDQNKPIVEKTEEEKIKIMEDAITEAFANYKEDKSKGLISFPMYDFLDRRGYFKHLTKVEKNDYMEKAKQEYKRDLIERNKFVSEVQKIVNGDFEFEKEKLVVIAKKLAVIDLFEKSERIL